MRIAVFHNLPAGGAKRSVYEQVKYLSRQHSLDLFELSCSQEHFKDIRPFCKKVFKFNFKADKSFTAFLTSLKRVHYQIAKTMNQGGYDVALIHADQYSESPYLLRYLKIPSLYYAQEYLRIGYEKGLALSDQVNSLNRMYENFTRWLRKTIDRSNARSAYTILTSSRFTQSNIEKAYSRKAVVCYLGVDHHVFKPCKIKKLNQVLFVGSPSKLKGYDLALKALVLIPKSIRPKLLVLNAYAKDMVNNDEKLAQIYSQSLATLCLGYREPFGLSAIESMACGTPVVALNDGGYKETVPKEFLVSKNPKNIADKINELINNPRLVKTDFSWDKHNLLVEQELLKLSQPKILISGQDSGGFGGSEKFLVDLADEFKNQGHEVNFTAISNSKFSRFLQESGYQPSNLKVRMDILGGWKGLLKFFLYLIPSLISNYHLLKTFKTDNPAKIIIPNFTDKIILSPLAKFLGYRVIWIEYAPLTSLFTRNFGLPKVFYRYAVRYADKIVCPTKNTYQKLTHEHIFDKTKLVIIPVGLKINK